MGFFFVLAGAARATCIIGLVDRPLCLALMAAAITGDWPLTLPLGIVLELLWLDAAALGGVVPPFPALSYLVAYPLCRHLGLSQADGALLPLALSLLAAHAAAWCERRQRGMLDGAAEAVAAWTRGEGGLSPRAAVLRASLWRACWQFFLHLASFCLCGLLLRALPPEIVRPYPGLGWPALYAAAMAGVLLTLRTRHAYAVLAAAFAALGAWSLL